MSKESWSRYAQWVPKSTVTLVSVKDGVKRSFITLLPTRIRMIAGCNEHGESVLEDVNGG